MKWIACWAVTRRILTRSMVAVGIIVSIPVSILLLLCATSAFSFAQDDDAGARAQVLGLEKTWNQAYKAGDVKALSAILDNSLVLVEDDGSLKTKSEFLATVKASTANQEQVAPESLSVRIFGDTAIAIGVIAVKESRAGKSVIHRERFIDTWIRKNGTWICIATDATPMTHAGA